MNYRLEMMMEHLRKMEIDIHAVKQLARVEGCLHDDECGAVYQLEEAHAKAIGVIQRRLAEKRDS